MIRPLVISRSTIKGHLLIDQGQGGLENTNEDVDLRIDGKNISRVCVDKTLTLEILEKNSKTVIRISSQFSIVDGQSQLNLSGDRSREAKEAAVLFGKTV